MFKYKFGDKILYQMKYNKTAKGIITHMWLYRGSPVYRVLSGEHSPTINEKRIIKKVNSIKFDTIDENKLIISIDLSIPFHSLNSDLLITSVSQTDKYDLSILDYCTKFLRVIDESRFNEKQNLLNILWLIKEKYKTNS